MLAHGCHLVDMARYLCGEIVEVQARHLQRFGAHSWFVDVAFANGALGHLDLTVAVRMDWHEGFQLYGENGSILGRIFNPWLFRSSEVDIFREATGSSSRILGADGHVYRRQLESFADSVLDDTPVKGADVTDGVASVRPCLPSGCRYDRQAGQALRCIRGRLMGLGVCQDLYRHRSADRPFGKPRCRIRDGSIQHVLFRHRRLPEDQ